MSPSKLLVVSFSSPIRKASQTMPTDTAKKNRIPMHSNIDFRLWLALEKRVRGLRSDNAVGIQAVCFLESLNREFGFRAEDSVNFLLRQQA